MDFRLPELGEGIDSATVVSVLVKPGDAVTAGQSVVSIETDKAALDVPVDSSGTVAKVMVKPGDKLAIGAPILQLGLNAAKSDGKKPRDTPQPRAEQPKSQTSIS